MEKEKLVELGVSGKPHGIKGGFLFKLNNNEESVLIKGAVVYLYPSNKDSSIPESGEKLTIKSISFGNKVICYFDGVTDRNIVEAMLPFGIYYPREDFPDLDDGEFYISDLMGLKVISPEGEELGLVDSHYDNGFQVILCVVVKGKKIELPFVENFFPEINIESGEVTMLLPEYS
jgi:16S rRNA processing protein RimM